MLSMEKGGVLEKLCWLAGGLRVSSASRVRPLVSAALLILAHVVMCEAEEGGNNREAQRALWSCRIALRRCCAVG